MILPTVLEHLDEIMNLPASLQTELPVQVQQLRWNSATSAINTIYNGNCIITEALSPLCLTFQVG